MHRQEIRQVKFAASVLIVEDEGVVAIEIMGRLLDMGHRVLGIAKSGETAPIKIKEGLPDVVLIDVVLHGKLSGTDVTRTINEQYGTPVIYITAHSDAGTIERMNGTKHFGILHKPVEPQHIRDAIETALQARRDASGCQQGNPAKAMTQDAPAY